MRCTEGLASPRERSHRRTRIRRSQAAAAREPHRALCANILEKEVHLTRWEWVYSVIAAFTNLGALAAARQAARAQRHVSRRAHDMCVRAAFALVVGPRAIVGSRRTGSGRLTLGLALRARGVGSPTGRSALMC